MFLGTQAGPGKVTGIVRPIAILAALVLLSGACQGGGHSTGAPSAGTAPTDNVVVVPRSGGNLIVGTEAEVASGFDPTASLWDATGYLYANTVFDPLMALAADGTPTPYLAQSLTANVDSTQWTFRLRPAVKFVDGELFDADALVLNLDAQRRSAVTGQALSDVASVDKVDDLTVRVTMKTPWPAFAALMAAQPGYPIAPRSLADKNRAQHPIGTGPFILSQWLPGDHFTAVKNPNYWRPGLPRLDSVEFRPLPDPQSRENSLKGGTVDLIDTADPQNILDFRHDPTAKFVEETRGRTEEDVVMLNTTAPPLNDLRVRQALAYATDRVRFNAIQDLGVFKVAEGPFSSDSGYQNGTPFPAYDPQKARLLIAEYKQATHLSTVSVTLTTTNTSQSLAAAQFLEEMWSLAGIGVRITQVDQSTLVNDALLGQFQAVAWRQFGEPDADIDNVWWNSANAAPNGQPALNFARNRDSKIDADLANARLAADSAQRKSLYTDIASQLNKDLPYLWITEIEWAVASKPNVEDVDRATSPGGVPLRGLQAGVFSLSQIWRKG
jgi:peptide/nickel transport system substrate-binding protein